MVASAKELLSPEEKKQIVKAIQEAESKTSGEIRLHLEDYCNEDVLDHAAYLFQKLKMHETEQRNGVLFYVSVKDKQFAILGDKGINEKVPNNFWDAVKTTVLQEFVLGNYSNGLCKGIELAGDKLRKFFPVKRDDKNELSDDISYG
ncbi:TPM domain-containing protein [Luteibaculum oceani]|uniref:TPM domain-containing protein n=1 Tax=Luteibaculum oceani TaxID=1294296 RepID=A0A5C6V959_9FLAO|nr:TPM domain-containing protein [Luteibaculum oceani]TXC81962.1 TPM domain-containing protein [Luteibaculum oceani]